MVGRKKVIDEYICECCNFSTMKKSKWERHISTRKHQENINKNLKNNNLDVNETQVATTTTNHNTNNNTNNNNNIVNTYCNVSTPTTIVNNTYKQTNVVKTTHNSVKKNIREKVYECICGKSYSYRQNYTRHKKTCYMIQDDIIDNLNELETHSCNVTSNLKNDSKVNPDKDEMIMEIMKENRELRNILKQQQTQISEIIPKIGNVTNNTTNNKFNLNVFLNETCKDALNLEDFVRSIELKLGDLEETAKIGYVEGMTNIIVRGLNELELTKRPIHCSDLKREVLYVKDNNEWERNNTKNDKMKRAIELINRSNMKQIPTWVAHNPQCMEYGDPKNDMYMSIITETMDDESHERDTAKIVKNIAKSVLIENGTENEDMLIENQDMLIENDNIEYIDNNDNNDNNYTN